MEPREYKNGMFQFAIDNGCAILPIALNNTHKAWSRKDVLDKADIHITIGKIIQPDTTDVEALKEQVRKEIAKLTASLPNTCYDDSPVKEETPVPAKKEL
jgi:1-acyl-sn-glycerol-3-phosphate acyltransferase